ncbi:MAG: hypothetical protein ABI624_06135, partial [Casimicrobiaceae bacterium]
VSGPRRAAPTRTLYLQAIEKAPAGVQIPRPGVSHEPPIDAAWLADGRATSGGAQPIHDRCIGLWYRDVASQRPTICGSTTCGVALGALGWLIMGVAVMPMAATSLVMTKLGAMAPMMRSYFT